MKDSLLQCSYVSIGSFRDHLTREQRTRSQGYRHGSNVPIPDSCVAANHSSTPSARVSTRPEGPADLDHLGTLES
jgi:hypothetical protein